ncbi:protein LYRIC isoform X1 [Etheostoma spectabile]|uniref:protein LYRIC isoform X1 n=1 Tax=Etheostoma spectabile TaxID=54343 RepID=UPI0013AEAFEC|nr:protein LYRIC-like isoform X1 [Etheostoma spectabile]
MEQWQDAASQQVKLLTNRLNELLSRGLGLLRSELGVDLGLKPELIPPWVILLAACSGLVLLVALWASVCRSLFKKRPAVCPVDDDGIEVKRGLGKPGKSEEPKKKKKKAEKKAQPNGRAVAEPQEDAIVSEETVPHHQPPPPGVKAEKVAELKKSKKKAKQAVKETKTATADGKEPEEGTWETKVSNKEKREQRKKDKGSSDGSASPGGGNTPVSVPSEQPKASAAPASASQKKRKGESAKVKPDKVEAVVSLVNSSEVVAVEAGVTDMAVKVPAPTVASKTGPWTTSREPASLWRADIDESWTVIDRGMPTTELTLVSLPGLGVGTAAEPPPVSELPWLSQPRGDDEWSGLNGGSVDPSSDWNAPSEAWGNYEEPTPEPPPAPEQPLPEPATASLLIGAADDDDDEKDKGETAADGAAKTKKKKKKKKKAAEEGGISGQGDEPEKETPPAASVKKQPPVQENAAAAAVQPVRAAAVEARVAQPVKDNISQKPPVTQVPQKPTDGEPTAKQNSLSAPTQQKKNLRRAKRLSWQRRKRRGEKHETESILQTSVCKRLDILFMQHLL